MLKAGLYKMVATAEFGVSDPDTFITRRRGEKIDKIKLGTEFQVLQSSHDDHSGLIRLLVIVNGKMGALSVGEMVPGTAFERVEQKSARCTA